jgi:hypothetical protein
MFDILATFEKGSDGFQIVIDPNNFKLMLVTTVTAPGVLAPLN